MAISQTTCTSFKLQLLKAEHDFDTHTFKIALYSSAASLGADTTVYSTTNEISNTSGSAYSAGGKPLTVTSSFTKDKYIVGSLSGAKAFADNVVGNDIFYHQNHLPNLLNLLKTNEYVSIDSKHLTLTGYLGNKDIIDSLGIDFEIGITILGK